MTAGVQLKIAVFTTLSSPGRAELRVRGSVFLATAVPATSEEEARALVAEEQRVRFDATHVCSAWVLQDGVRRAHDAGEPGGSAGPPILAAIDGAGLVNVVVLVTRYYGGTKLGVGGLIRAYGEAAAGAIAAAPRRIAHPAVAFRVRYPYRHTAAVMRVLDRVGAAEVEHGATPDGSAGVLTCVVAAIDEARFGDLLRDASAGELAPQKLGDRTLYVSVPEGGGKEIA